VYTFLLGICFVRCTFIWQYTFCDYTTFCVYTFREVYVLGFGSIPVRLLEYMIREYLFGECINTTGFDSFFESLKPQYQLPTEPIGGILSL
jgi:hypothetical protein